MKGEMKLAITVVSGLVIGFGGWYIYSQYKKRKESQKLGMGKPSSAPIASNSDIKLAPNATEQSLVGVKPKRPTINISPDATTQSIASSGFNGQEMVTRYQKPFWTVG